MTFTTVAMPIPLHQLWRRDFVRDRHPDGLSVEELSVAEKRLGVHLPVTLKCLYRIQDGGFFVDSQYDVPTLAGHPDAFWEGPEFERLCYFECLRDSGWNFFDHCWDQLIGIVHDGARFLCLDYRESGSSGEPSLTYINAELDEDVRIAISFDEYVLGLKPFDKFA